MTEKSETIEAAKIFRRAHAVLRPHEHETDRRDALNHLYRAVLRAAEEAGFEMTGGEDCKTIQLTPQTPYKPYLGAVIHPYEDQLLIYVGCMSSSNPLALPEKPMAGIGYDPVTKSFVCTKKDQDVVSFVVEEILRQAELRYESRLLLLTS